MPEEKGLIVQEAIVIPTESGVVISETQELRQQISRQIQNAKLQGKDDIQALGESYYNLVIKYMTDFIEKSKHNAKMANFKMFSIEFRERETGKTEIFIEEEYRDGSKECTIEYLGNVDFKREAFDYLQKCILNETGFKLSSEMVKGLYRKRLDVVPE